MWLEMIARKAGRLNVTSVSRSTSHGSVVMWNSSPLSAPSTSMGKDTA